MHVTGAFLFALITCVYGRKTGHVVGGRDVNITDYPWVGNIRGMDVPYCTGVLINDQQGSPRYILTTAYCATNEQAVGHISVRMGHNDGFQGKQFFVEEVTAHPDYDNHPDRRDITFAHDIAVMRLNTTATGENIRTATLAEAGSNYDGQKCRFVGWGRVDRHIEGLYPDGLQIADNTIITNSECNTTFNGIPFGETEPEVLDVLDEQMCAMDKTNTPPNVAPCDGDEGTGLHCGANFDVVVGLLSFMVDDIQPLGTDCKPDTPTMYTRVSMYLDWIRENTP